MQVYDFITALHNELNEMILPTCSTFGQIGVSFVLGALDYNAAQYMSSNKEFLQMIGIVSADGEVNIDCAEHAILTGFKFPQMVGPLKFEKADVEKIFSAIRNKGRGNGNVNTSSY